MSAVKELDVGEEDMFIGSAMWIKLIPELPIHTGS
jgi:hypothetical protein